MLKAANYALKSRLKLITLTGFKKNNPLSKKGLINLWVDSSNYNHIENLHQILLLTICDYIAKKKF